jgi:hypothetical protein
MHSVHNCRPLFWTILLSLAAAAPAIAGADKAPPQTGELVLTFHQRSPLSSRKEVARRLSEKEYDAKDDYDLSTFTFQVYVPRNYDPKISYGIFVYLGNHDVASVPTQWEPVFDKSHMIFIGPDWNGLTHEWQLIGLGFDAVDNLMRLYNIDSHRLYDMWFGSENLDIAFAGADVYTGMIFGRRWEYFRRVKVPDKNAYLPASIPPPLPELLQKARPHGVVLLNLTDEPDDGSGGGPVIAMALKQDGFTHVLSIRQTVDEVHYPNYAPNWIGDSVLPFLDKAAQQSVAMTPTPSTRPSDASPSASPQARHLLTMAKLYLTNGNTERARTNLQAIVGSYPHDPAATEAKKLLASLPPPPAAAVGRH